MEHFDSIFTQSNYGFNSNRESTTQFPINSPYRVEFALEKSELENLCSLLKQSLDSPNGHTFDDKYSLDLPSQFGTKIDSNWNGSLFPESTKMSSGSRRYPTVTSSFSQSGIITPVSESNSQSLVSQLNGVPISPSPYKLNIKPSSISPPHANGNHTPKTPTLITTPIETAPISQVGRTSPTISTVIPSPTTSVPTAPLTLPVGSPSIELAAQIPNMADIWHTNPQTHNNDCVQKIFYINHLEGVPKSENNSGWLFSTSKGVISLWQCLEHSTTPLELVHSEHIDERILSMDVAQSSFFLITASLPQQIQYLPQNPVKLQPSITLYSLGNDAAKFLKPKGKIPLSIEPTQVLSLDNVGPLNFNIACSTGKSISIYDLRQATTPKVQWTAHNDIVSLLKRNPFSISIASGSWDGSIHLWDLKSKPSQPQVALQKHARAITSIEFLDANNLISGSADGSVLFWDLRKASSPVQSTIVDEKSILNCKLLGSQKMAAVATLKGLYVMDITTRQVKPVTNPAFKIVFPDITWNMTQASPTLYTSTMDGKINVLSSLPTGK